MRWLRKLTHDQRIVAYILTAAAPALGLAVYLLWAQSWSTTWRWLLISFLVLWLLLAVRAARITVLRPLQIIANLLAGLREGHFTMRARGGDDREDELTSVFREVNALSDTLESQRIGAVEADALLRRVMEEIEVVVFAFDGHRTLRLANRAGQRLLGLPLENILGKSADTLGLRECVEGSTPRTIEAVFPGGRAGRWEVRRSSFRQEGLPMELVVLADLSRALREEERQVWQRLVRVLSHEINNSLAPIKSLAGTLRGMLDRSPRAPDYEEDLRSGLEVIGGRSEALERLMGSYARLARLPPPTLGHLKIDEHVRRVAELEARLPVQVVPGPRVTVRADADQLDQLLINLVKNGVEAALETGGGVEMGWSVQDHALDLWVRDEGKGLSSTANLFVPFYTTKRGGSGIGLVFSRQVAEAHGGTLTLANRRDHRGCEARLHLPNAAETAEEVSDPRS